MKLLSTLVILLSLQTAYAQNLTNINPGDVAINSASSKLISIKTLCPERRGVITCLAYGSVLEIRVKLNGCADTFGGYFSNFKIVNGEGVLSFGAMNIVNEQSEVALCRAFPTKTVTVVVPHQGKIQFEELSYTGKNQL